MKMHTPPKIQVQFLIEPPDAPMPEYNRSLPKFAYVGNILDNMFRYLLLFAVSIGIVILVILCAVLDRRIK